MEKTSERQNQKPQRNKPVTPNSVKTTSSSGNLLTNLFHNNKMFSSQSNNQNSNAKSSKCQLKVKEQNVDCKIKQKIKEPEYAYASGSSTKSSSNTTSPKKFNPLNSATAPKTLSILQALNELNLPGEMSKLKGCDNLPEHFMNGETHNAILNESPTIPDISPAAKKKVYPSSQRKSNTPQRNNLNQTLSSNKSFNEMILDEMNNIFSSECEPAAWNDSKSSSRASLPSQNKFRQQTRNWIARIFRLTKRGQLDQMREELFGLDLAVIRHLVDSRGNNLLHFAVSNGKLEILAWLTTILGDQFESALNDQNRAGRNVIQTALKTEQLDCVEWLIQNTSVGCNALSPKDGKRSLLHYAVKYNLLEAVYLLSEIHAKYRISMDICDASYFTPLHIAAKFGRIRIAEVLIQFGADPSFRTDLGCSPSDVALKYHQIEALSYFSMAETASTFGKNLQTILTQLPDIQNNYEIICSHFRELLRVSKYLVKERSDLIKHFSGSSSSGLKSSSPEDFTMLLLGGTTKGFRFSDLEHKLVQAENAWKLVGLRQESSSPASFDCWSRKLLNLNSGDNNDIKDSYSLQNYLVSLQQNLQTKKKGSYLDLLSSSSSSSTGEESSSDKCSDYYGEDLLDDGNISKAKEEPMYHNVHVNNVPQMKENRVKLPTPSLKTPWLMPSSEISILASLSTEKPDKNTTSNVLSLDLLRSVTSITSSGSSNQGNNSAVKHSPYSSLSSLEQTAAAVMTLVPNTPAGDLNTVNSAPAVIEVIEPLFMSQHPTTTSSSEDIAAIQKPPVLIPSSSSAPVPTPRKNTTVESCHNLNTAQNSNTTCQIALTTTKENSHSHHHITTHHHNKRPQVNSSSAVCHSNECKKIKDPVEQVYFTPDLIKGTHRQSWEMNTAEFNGTQLDSSSINKSRNIEEMNSPANQQRTDTSTSTTPPHGISNKALNKNRSCNNLNETGIVTDIVKNRRAVFETNLTVLPVTTISQPEVMFPVQIVVHENSCTTSRFPISTYQSSRCCSDDDTFKTFITNNTFQTSAQKSRPPELFSTDETEMMMLPSIKTNCISITKPQSSPIESTGSLNGHQSPNLSETESNIAPPPSQASQTSNMSKTESGRYPAAESAMPVVTLIDDNNKINQSRRRRANFCHDLPKSTKEDEIIYLIDTEKTTPVDQEDKGHCDYDRSNQMKKDDKEDNDEMNEKSRTMELIRNYCSKSTTSSNSSLLVSDERYTAAASVAAARDQSLITLPVTTTTTNSTLRNTLSINSQKPFHNKGLIKLKVKKPKPWYEVDVSDDEDQDLLQFSRTRSISDDDDSENGESDLNTQDTRHECESSTCSEYNCPNFV